MYIRQLNTNKTKISNIRNNQPENANLIPIGRVFHRINPKSSFTPKSRFWYDQQNFAYWQSRNMGNQYVPHIRLST